MKGSAFVALKDRFDRLENERVSLQKRVDESKAAEERLRRARDDHAAATAAATSADEALADVRLRYAQSKAIGDATEKKNAAQRALEDIEEQGRIFDEKKKRVASLAEEAGRLSCALEDARLAREKAHEAQQKAEEQVRQAKSDEGAHAREARRAQLQNELLSADGREKDANRLHERATSAASAAKALEEAIASEKSIDAEVTKAAKLLEGTKPAMKSLETERALLEATIMYGQWRRATNAAKEAECEEAEIARIERDANAKESEADQGESVPRTQVPTSDEIDALTAIDNALSRAEARLEGIGLSVCIRPQRDVHVVARRDDGDETVAVGANTTLLLEAARTLALTIDESIAVDITVGSEAQRAEHESARALWNERVRPKLEAAKTTDIAGLRALRKTLDETAATAQRLRFEARLAREEATRRTERMNELRTRATRASTYEEAIAKADLVVLAGQFEQLGQEWEYEADRRLKANGEALEQARQTCESAKRSMAVDSARLTLAKERVEECQKAMNLATNTLGVGIEEARTHASRELKSALEEKTRITAALDALDREVSDAVQTAEAALARAIAEFVECDDRHRRCADSVREAETLYATTAGATAEFAEVVAKLDRASAEKRVVECLDELQNLPTPAAPASEDDVKEARLSAETASKARDTAATLLAEARGSVESVAGFVVEDQLRDITEALAGVKGEQIELEQDGKAWRLLVTTLKEVQSEQGAHLGRALSTPLNDRLSDLTHQRYRVELDPHLQPHKIEGMSGDEIEDMLRAFSVGTREQLATLVRISLAECLKSVVVLDDHLVQSDPQRLEWFRRTLRHSAQEAQVIVFTCRPEDYLPTADMPVPPATWADADDGAVRAVDLGRVLKPEPSYSAPRSSSSPRERGLPGR